MKKSYFEPELEILSIRLLFDVLGSSQPTEPPTEDEIPIEGTEFEEL